MRRPLTRFLVLSLLMGASAALTACGDDDVAPARPVDPRKNRPKKKKSFDPTGQVDIHLTNPRWDILKAHFTKMATKRHTPVHDVFKPQVLNFIPRPEMPEVAEVVEDVEAEVEEVRGPLQLFPLADYELLLIMSGTTVPKALVADPKGQTHVVTRDMRMGAAGGIVEHVGQYMVVVREPNSERPYKLTIKPPFMELASKIAPPRRSESETADATPPGETAPTEP
jgi:hypothetical protein